MENLNQALFLMVTGMIIVLVVLSLVVGLGNLVISLTNRYLPEETPGDKKQGGKPYSSKVAAVVAAVVDAVTHGKGRVDSITKK